MLECLAQPAPDVGVLNQYALLMEQYQKRLLHQILRQLSIPQNVKRLLKQPDSVFPIQFGKPQILFSHTGNHSPPSVRFCRASGDEVQ